MVAKEKVTVITAQGKNKLLHTKKKYFENYVIFLCGDV